MSLAVFQQWCGINVIFNYAQEVFAAAGYQVSDILLNIVMTGVVNLAFTFVAMFTVDRVGRRPLMLLGAAGLAICLPGAGLQLSPRDQGLAGSGAGDCRHRLLCVHAWRPVTWVVLSEIFPNRIRGAAMAVAVFALWIGCFTLTYSFPFLNSAVGSAGTFWVYCAICVLGFLVIWRKLPETKDKSLEEIERELVD